MGSILQNSGDGIALEIVHGGKDPAERITVEGQGLGEIISNTGSGTAKKIISTGGGSGSEISVNVTKSVKRAIGMGSSIIIADCQGCGRMLRVTKVIQGFAGDDEPRIEAKCPHCGASTWV